MRSEEELERLIDALDGLDEATRVDAAKRLGRFLHPAALQALTRCSEGDESPGVRFEASKAAVQLRSEMARLMGSAEAASRIHDGGDLRKAVDAAASAQGAELRLRSLLAAPDRNVRGNAVKAAVSQRVPEARAILHARLPEETDPQVRGLIVMAIAVLGGRDELPFLFNLVQNASPEGRFAAVKALASIDDVGIFPILVYALSDTTGEVSRAAFKRIQRLGKANTVKLFRKMVASSKEWMRESAVSACARFANAEVLGVLEIALNDDQSHIRRLARRALDRLSGEGSSEAAAILDRANRLSGDIPVAAMASPLEGEQEDPLRDPNPETRLQTVKELVRSGDADRLPDLIRRLPEETHPHVLAALLLAVGRLGGGTEVEVLRPFLQSEDDRVRASAVEGLAATEDLDGLKLLVPLVSDPHNRVRANAISALSSLPDFELVEPLRTMVESDDPFMRRSAIYVITTVSSADTAELIEPLLEDPDPDVRAKAEEAKEILAQQFSGLFRDSRAESTRHARRSRKFHVDQLAMFELTGLALDLDDVRAKTEGDNPSASSLQMRVAGNKPPGAAEVSSSRPSRLVPGKWKGRPEDVRKARGKAAAKERVREDGLEPDKIWVVAIICGLLSGGLAGALLRAYKFLPLWVLFLMLPASFAVGALLRFLSQDGKKLALQGALASTLIAFSLLAVMDAGYRLNVLHEVFRQIRSEAATLNIPREQEQLLSYLERKVEGRSATFPSGCFRSAMAYPASGLGSLRFLFTYWAWRYFGLGGFFLLICALAAAVDPRRLASR